jgi:hypothetical protein
LHFLFFGLFKFNDSLSFRLPFYVVFFCSTKRIYRIFNPSLQPYHTEFVSNGKMNGFLKANKLGTPAQRNRRCSKLGESQNAYSTPELVPSWPLREGGKHGTLTRCDRDRCVRQGVTGRTFTAGTQFFYLHSFRQLLL